MVRNRVIVKCPTIVPGKEYHGNSLELMKCLPDKSVNLVVTSPPYAQMRKKQYGGIDPDEYPGWFEPFAKEIHRVLTDDGSFVFNIKENIVDGEKSFYVNDTVRKIHEQGFRWNETYVWHKPNPFPMKPVSRFKDGYEHIFHFTKQKDFKFRPGRVMEPVKSKGYCKSLHKAKARYGGAYDNGLHPLKYDSFLKNCDKAYPSNVMTISAPRRTRHPGQFPPELPAFFIKVMSDPGDVVLDPFSGSGTTISEATRACRKGIGFDVKKEYVDEANEGLKKVSCIESGTTS